MSNIGALSFTPFGVANSLFDDIVTRLVYLSVPTLVRWRLGFSSMRILQPTWKTRNSDWVVQGLSVSDLRCVSW